MKMIEVPYNSHKFFFSLIKFFHFYLSDFHHLCIVVKYIYYIFKYDTNFSREPFFQGTCVNFLRVAVVVYMEMENTWIWGCSCWQLIIFLENAV